MHSKSQRDATEVVLGRGIVGRAKGAVVARVLAYLPPKLATAAKLRAAADGTSVSALVAEALKQYLNTRKS